MPLLGLRAATLMSRLLASLLFPTTLLTSRRVVRKPYTRRSVGHANFKMLCAEDGYRNPEERISLVPQGTTLRAMTIRHGDHERTFLRLLLLGVITPTAKRTQNRPCGLLILIFHMSLLGMSNLCLICSSWGLHCTLVLLLFEQYNAMSTKKWRNTLPVPNIGILILILLEILQEMAICSKEYLENRCAPNTRVPAMEKACSAWEKCMNRDPTVVGRARVSAETFAEIINSFIEPISYKTMVVPLKIIIILLDILSSGCLWISFSFQFRIRSFTTTRSTATVHPVSATCTASDPCANAESSHDESMDWKHSGHKSATNGESPKEGPET